MLFLIFYRKGTYIMFKIRFLSITMLALSVVAAKASDTSREVHVLNDSPGVMDINAHSSDFNFGLKVPSYAKAFVMAHMTKLDTVQEMLFAAICKNSVIEVRQAIVAGAKVNQLKADKTPLAWALELGSYNVIACLIQHGAQR
jgi:hypothetical protein